MTKVKKKTNLINQIFIHSVDTAAFYNEEENRIQTVLMKHYTQRKELMSLIIKDKVEKPNKSKKSKKSTYDKKNYEYWLDLDIVNIWVSEIQRIIKLELVIINDVIDWLLSRLKEKFPLNEEVRHLRKDVVMKRMIISENETEWIDAKKTIISVFESNLSRTLGIETNKHSKDIIVVKTHHQIILKDLVLKGFLYDGLDEKGSPELQRFVFLTASAGQIREKKNLFIREKVYNLHKDALTCGLSDEIINAKGGLNTNKKIAYSALFSSASQVWEKFDIDRAICVEDMEFDVTGEVDYIDVENFIPKREPRNIPINHTDGCGICLPSVSRKNFQFRLPWMKGLLTPVDFKSFCDGNKKKYWITDIDGKKRHILRDKINIIFTRSQWKAAKYYDSWAEYQRMFKLFGCEASKCNIEEDVIGNAKLNYQLLQSLNEITNEELTKITEKTRKTIENIGLDRNTMLRVMGVVDSNEKKNWFQQGLELYPELLNDSYSKQKLKEVKASMYKRALQAKLEIEGRYTFILPDTYAFCQWLFLKHKKPKGLLGDGEVYCKLFKDEKKLDVCRSPHLFREHGIRINKVDNFKKNWFKTGGIYTSTRDLISKLLQFDVDGDFATVISDEYFVSIAERHMIKDNIVPLYYEMGSAKADQINEQTIFDGLKKAYGGIKIGTVSNDIAKVWNSGNVNLDIIRLLVMKNNYSIDFAKTLYMPKFSKEINKMIREYTKAKLPNFFIYAKDKKENEVEPLKEENESVVNRLQEIIPPTIIQFKAKNLGKFDYKTLMSNQNYTYVESDQAIIDKYEELNQNKKFMTIEFISDDIESADNLYIYFDIRNQILEINNDVKYVTDVLVNYLYTKRKANFKTTLWSSFGDELVNNLSKNVNGRFENGFGQCDECGERFKVERERQKNCNGCQSKLEKERKRLQKQKEREKKKNVSLRV